MKDESLVTESTAVATRCRRALSAALGNAERRPGSHYVIQVDDNLVGCTVADIRGEFGAGSGGELKNKIRAPWSSSAPCASAFCRWRIERSLDLLSIAGTQAFDTLIFERKYPHGIKGPPPHLDAELMGASAICAVESKCLEPVDLSLKHEAVVSTQYEALAALSDPRANSRWFAALSEVATFDCLDAYQLIKHYLGFVRAHTHGSRILVYIYWQPLNDEHEVFVRHREEIARFESLVSDDPTCTFRPLSYAEHWKELDLLVERLPWLEDHLSELRRRYEIEV